jgi:hypothetical protein
MPKSLRTKIASSPASAWCRLACDQARKRKGTMWNKNIIDPDMPAMLKKPKLIYLVGRGFEREQALAILRMWDWLTPAVRRRGGGMAARMR